MRSLLVLFLPLLLAAGPSLTVELPEGTRVQSATATALKLDVKGTVHERSVTFAGLLPDTAYDIRLTLADGTVLQGFSLEWYAPADDKAEPRDDDDRQQIQELFDGIKGFENKRKILAMDGNHDRVTVLAELIRDNGFHSDAGEEIIWRVELWYFKNQHGGWEKVAQQNKVLRRERFKTQAAYKAATHKLKWVPNLGGIRLKPEESRTVRVDPAAKAPGARP